MTITRDQMLSQARAACPDWMCDEDEDNLYLALRDFGWHIWNQILVTDHKKLKPAFAVFERWLLEGDKDVQLACQVGVFEALKHVKHGKGPDYHEARRAFGSLLGPVAKKEWDAA